MNSQRKLPFRGLIIVPLCCILFPAVAYPQAALDTWGGVIGWSCPANPKAQSYTITSVGRSGSVSTVTVSSASTVLQVGEWFTISGTTPDSGSFNSAANQVWTVATVSLSTITFSQTGNALTPTATGGTLTEAFWYNAKLGSHWLECSPVGNARWHVGIYEIDSGNFNAALLTAKYGSLVAWAQNAIKRIKAWNFNSCFYCDSHTWSSLFPNQFTANIGYSTVRNRSKETGQVLAPQAPKSILRAEDAVNGYNGYLGSATQDPFDPNYLIYLDRYWYAVAQQESAAVLNPWFQYIQSDDLDYNWGLGAGPDIDVTAWSLPSAHDGWLALAASPVDYGLWWFSAMYYPPNDPTVFSKREVLNWLQGQGANSYTKVRSASCNSAGTAATLTFDANPFNVGDSIWVNGMVPADLSISYTSPVIVSSTTATSATFSTSCTGNETASATGVAVSVASKPVSVSRSGTTETVTFATNNPFVAGNSVVDGDVVTIAGMAPSSLNTTPGSGCVVSTSSATSFTCTNGSGSATASVLGTVSSGPGYQSIATLNTNWGTSSYYTTFGTTGTTRTGISIGTGDGVTTSFPVSLSERTDNRSLEILVNGTVVADDEGDGNVNYIYGAGLVYQGTPYFCNCDALTYGTPTTFTLTFQTAPANGAAITANYTTGGWGHGSGLQDENGRHTTWLGDRYYGDLAGATAGVILDLNHFLYHYAAALYSADIEGIHKYTRRGMLTEGIDALGGHNGVSRKEVILAAVQYTDVVPFSIGDSTNRQAIVDFMANSGGDYPMLALVFSGSNPDSSFYMTSNSTLQSGGVLTADTQENRASQDASMVNWLVSALPTSGSSYPILGYNFWEYPDNSGETANWGLVSLSDNPYDNTRTSGPLYAMDPVTGYSNACLNGSTCEAGRVSHTSYASTGYFVIFFAPGATPASGASVTVDYTAGGTQYTGESVATGDGATRGFSHSFAHAGAITPGSVTVRVNGTAVATDNGSGWFTGAAVDGPEPHGDAITPIKNANAAWRNLIPFPQRTQGTVGGTTY